MNLKSIEYILFDLDGTITDSSPGISNSCRYALRKFGIEPPPTEDFHRFIGPPLAESFSKYYGMSDEEADITVTYYREYYKERGIKEISLYDGVKEMLRDLHAAGKKLILATSKPEVFAKMILADLGIDRYFFFAAGALFTRERNEKDEVIAYAVQTLGIDTSKCIMVGDRENDVIGAKKNNMYSCGVLYGFGSYEELSDADLTVSTAAEFTKLMLE